MTAEDFKQVVLPISDKLLRYAYRFLRDNDAAQDAVQEVYVKLWKQRTSLSKIENIEAFAVRITRNHCLDIIKTTHTVSLDVNDYYKDRITDDENPHEKLQLSDAVAALKKVIHDMPEPQRSVILMRDIEGFDNDEIAESLGITEGNVRVILSRARKKVRYEMVNNYEYETEGNKAAAGKIL